MMADTRAIGGFQVSEYSILEVLARVGFTLTTNFLVCMFASGMLLLAPPWLFNRGTYPVA